MQKIRMILILCLFYFTASSQSDTTKICFTQGQVKVFLLTKAELNQCLDVTMLKDIKIDSLTTQNNEVSDALKTTKDKLKRTRQIGLGAGILSVIFGLLLFM